MKDTTMNMTAGNPVKLILIFSVPLLIGNIFQQFYNLADSIIVGRFINADALAAIGVTASLTFLFFAICNGFGSGGGIIVSQSFGRGDTKEVKNCIANTGYIMICLPLAVGILAFALSRPLLRLLETPENIFEDSLVYLKLMCVGLLFVSVYNYISSMMRALGDSRTPLYFLIFTCILNALLDLLFVCVLKQGIWGAGIATLISQFVSNILCLAYAFKFNEYFKFDKSDLRLNKIILIRTVKLGVPLSLQFSLIAISCMALQRVVNAFGAVTVAAFTATSRIEQIIHQPYQTLSAALATFCGQNYGARKNGRVIDGYHKTFWMMVIFTAVMVPVIQLFARQIAGLFVEEADVIEMSAKAMRITSYFYICLGIIYVVRGILNGLGDAFFALLNGIIEVIGRFFVPVIMTAIPAVGLWGIWWSVGIVWLLSGLTAWLRYIYKKRMLN
ncbi:MAG: MATE family efflux transporter [Spirochaetaceae bacterium]|nr:MATE family efflux transporter [Spirochaetaceae bacterium]